MRIEEGGAGRSPQRKGGPAKGKKDDAKRGGRAGKGGYGAAAKRQDAPGARKTGPVKEKPANSPSPANQAAA